MLINDDCLTALKGLAPNSIDALVTDPPAGISFMGKDWDKDKGGREPWIAWMTEVMAECLRVMKPGAHGLVWAIPRTSHWTATALENAGFEVRDVVTHLFGSGFPKSLDISKAIDKAAGAKREVVGINKNVIRDSKVEGGSDYGGFTKADASITAPATDEAKQWQGFGTALKPSNERWVLVRKPLSAVPLNDIVQETHLNLGALCQLSSATFAGIISTSNQHELLGEQDFVPWPAAVLNTISNVGWLELMDTFRSREEAKTFLNIVLLWNDFLGVNLESLNTSTTKTVSDLITELKTLNSWLSMNMRESTTQGETNQNGVSSSACIAGTILSESLARLQNILTPFVRANVSLGASLQVSRKLQLLPVEGAVTKAPFSEDYILVRKPLSEKTVAANVLKHGVGGINIDGCRIGTGYDRTHGGIRKASHESNPETFQTGMDQHARPTGGRFPANLLLSHTLFCDTECTDDCPVKMLDEQSGVLKSGALASDCYTKDRSNESMFAGDGKFKHSGYKADTGGASRFFYVAKASKKDRNEGLEGMAEKVIARSNEAIAKEKRGEQITDDDKRFGGMSAGKSQNHHPTVKSTKLMEYLITLVTPPGGTVLDCFMGSGSTGKAARGLGFSFVGIEREKEYFEIAEKRIG